MLTTVLTKKLRVDIKPRRLARNFSNIIEGVLYQPPNADDNPIKDYLLSSLESVEGTLPIVLLF